MGIFASQVKAAGLEAEYDDFLKIHKQATVSEKEIDVNKMATEKNRLEEKVETAKAKVEELRIKTEEIEGRLKKKDRHRRLGGGMGSLFGFIGGMCVPTMTAAGTVLAIAAGTAVGAVIGLGIAYGLYYLTLPKEGEKAYNDKNEQELEETRKALQAAEQEVQRCEVEYQHFMNNL